MFHRIVVFLGLIAVMLIISHVEHLDPTRNISPTLILGFLLLAAYTFGYVLEKVKLPGITAYIFAGLAFGPYLLNFITDKSITDLSFINSLALSFIAFCAGGELKMASIRKQRRSIINLVISQIVIEFAGISIVVFFLLDTIPLFSDFDFTRRLVIALIFGVISIALSPSSTIAIISETKSEGFYTNIVLSITIIKDVAVIVLFGITISYCQTLLENQNTVHWFFFPILLIEVITALVLGYLLGKGIVYLIETVKVEFPVVMIGIGFLVIKFSHMLTTYLHDAQEIAFTLEPLLICIAAGFTVQNFSTHGKRFLKKMDSVSLPIYIVFFTIAGASINLDVLKASWLAGLAIVCVRLVMLFVSSSLGGMISRDEPLLYKHYWLGFITQAGVSFGLLTEVVRRFPSIGIPIQSLLIAVITINQIIGPIAFKYALTKVGDTKKKE